MTDKKYTLGIDIGSTTVKIAILDEENQLLFADYERHFANIQETLAHLLGGSTRKAGRTDPCSRSSPVPADLRLPTTSASRSRRKLSRFPLR